MKSLIRAILSALLTHHYLRLPMATRVLSLCVRLEGGQLKSPTLRAVLAQHHGVQAGLHSYGSLLQPGMSDANTVIGRYVSVGPNVRRFGAAHPLNHPSLHPYWYNPRLGLVGKDADVPRSQCTIGDDVWVGANVVILPGCSHIGDGAVIGAGSVVTRDIPPFSIVVGVPGKVVGERLTVSQRRWLLDHDVWALEPNELRQLLDRFPGRETNA